MVEIKANEEIARANQRVRDAIERLAEEKGKFKDAESEWSDRMREVQLANQKEVAELKASYENRIQEMKDDFDKRLNDTRFSARRMPQNYSQDSNMVRCRGCAGKGFITEKRSCQHCGGSGKIRTTSEGLRKGGYNRSTRVSVSTVFADCPYCQPGAMKGGGSKGYTIERQTCPNCDGSGMMSK